MSLDRLRSLALQAFSSKPTITEKNVPDLTGKVCLVTGSNTGIGKEIAQILYANNAKVYLAARSEEKTRKAMDSIRVAVPKSTGSLEFIRLDLADLTTIKKSAEEFLAKENELHLLFNNAGLGWPEPGSKTVQGQELQMGVNCLGPFLFTKFLTPTLIGTAKNSPKESVRVIWSSSSACDGLVVDNTFMDYVEHPEKKTVHQLYCTSKIGNYFYGVEYAARYKADGLMSISLNPGHLDSDLWRTQGALKHWLLRKTVLHPVIYGAYTNLFAAFSSKLTIENNGTFVAPWGRIWQMTSDKVKAVVPKNEGGFGTSKEFLEWTEAQVKPYV